MHHRPHLIERHAAGGRIERQREDRSARCRAAGHHCARGVHRQGHRLVGQRVAQAAGDSSRLDAKGVSDCTGVLDIVVVRIQEPVGAERRREVRREALRVVGGKDALINRQHRQQRRAERDARTVIVNGDISCAKEIGSRRNIGITISQFENNSKLTARKQQGGSLVKQRRVAVRYRTSDVDDKLIGVLINGEGHKACRPRRA